MEFSKTNTAQPHDPTSPDGILTDILESLNTVLEDTFVLYNGRDNFYQGLVFKNAYYVGGTLCLDTNKSVTVLLNIASETFTIIPIGPGDGPTNIMPLKLLWMAFYIYLKAKGKSNYYMDCYGKSCIRHLYDDDMESLSKIADLSYKFAQVEANHSLN